MTNVVSLDNSRHSVTAVLAELVERELLERVVLAVRGPTGEIALVEGRDAQGPLSARACEDVSRTVIERAFEERRAVVLDPIEDAHASAAVLRIARAAAAPLDRNGSDVVVYTDVRRLDRVRRLSASSVQALADALAPHVSPRGELERALLLPGMTSIAGALRAWLVTDLPLLLLGEPGVGKTHLALALAAALGRTPVVRATLGSTDDLNTVTSELFGHERGAFSGALSRRVGLVEQADGGVLILDEILSVPRPVQALLLDFVQFGTYRPLGHAGREPKRVDVRLIGATNGDLRRAVAEGSFRADLADRLTGITVTVPSLRHRAPDVPAIAARILRDLDADAPFRLSIEARRELLAPERAWPGNVRELEFLVKRARAHALSEGIGRAIEPRHLRDDRATGPVEIRARSAGSLAERWRRLVEERVRLDGEEKDLIDEAMRSHGGVVARAARALGAKRTSLISRMAKLGVKGGA